MITLSWRLSRKLREKKTPLIVATYVSACSPRAAYTLRSDQDHNPTKIFSSLFNNNLYVEKFSESLQVDRDEKDDRKMKI